MACVSTLDPDGTFSLQNIFSYAFVLVYFQVVSPCQAPVNYELVSCFCSSFYTSDINVQSFMEK